MRFVLTHLPHLLPAVVAVGFLIKYGLGAASGPGPAPAEQEAEAFRHEAAVRARARRVRRSTATLGLLALAPLGAAVGTGAVLYAMALDGARPSAALTWTHSAVALVALALVAWKLADAGAERLRRGLDPRRALAEGVSLLLALLCAPLLVTGAVLLARPSSGSSSAYLHLVASAWWSVLLGAHLFRYLRRSVAAAVRGEAAVEVAGRHRFPSSTRH